MEVQFRAWGNVGSIMDHKALPSDNKDKQVKKAIITMKWSFTIDKGIPWLRGHKHLTESFVSR